MIQGTGSQVGKSLIALALCRYYSTRGYLTVSCQSRELALYSPDKTIKDIKSGYDLVIIEGEGSPVDIYLKQCAPANMETARLADAPVLLVGDIDRGGVFAHLVGTLDLLAPSDRARVSAFIINKFRGDTDRLAPGIRELEEITGKPVLGVLPYLNAVSLPRTSIGEKEKTADILAGWVEVNLNMPFVDSLLMNGI